MSTGGPTLERVTRGLGAVVGEGPLWWADRDRLLSVDLHGNSIAITDVRTGASQLEVFDVSVCALAPAGARFVAATEQGVAWWDPGAHELHPWLDVLDAGHRMNDGRCDARGRLWVGSLAREADRPTGVLYRVDADGEVESMERGLMISNGLDWSPDGTLLYLADSPTGRIDVFDHDPGTGTIANRRPFVTFDPAEGMPDGLCVDADGDLWVALWDGGSIRRIAPDGHERLRIAVPVRRVTSCAFGGDGWSDLYVTTAGYAAPEDERGVAGDIFVLPGVASGRPPNGFAEPRDPR